VVFFGFDKATLTPRGERAVDDAVNGIRSSGFECLEVQAGADRVGTSSYNLNLSRRRAAVVKAALIRRGIPADWIKLNPTGESEPVAATADEVAQPYNRIAQIIPACRRENWSPPQ
jgi:OOP family OmpA-OmpF porin